MGDATRRVPPGMRPGRHEIPRPCRLVNNLREELLSLVGCCARRRFISSFDRDSAVEDFTGAALRRRIEALVFR